MDLKEFVRQNEKMNSSLITDWSREMLLEAMQMYANEQLRLYRVSNSSDLYVVELSDEDLMICDQNKPLCLAGIYGGKDSGVSKSTKSIFLESAYFNAQTIRKSAKRHGFNTDASYRFERGIDPEICLIALKRAVFLMAKYANAVISSEIVEFQTPAVAPRRRWHV